MWPFQKKIPLILDVEFIEAEEAKRAWTSWLIASFISITIFGATSVALYFIGQLYQPAVFLSIMSLLLMIKSNCTINKHQHTMNAYRDQERLAELEAQND